MRQPKTHCPKGHPYSGENLVIAQTKWGPSRRCRTCKRATARRLIARAKTRPSSFGTPQFIESFWCRVDKSNECWVWKGGVGNQGYGLCYVYGGLMLAHRAVYRLCVGEIPDGLVIDHLCRNRICVRPEHLEAITSSLNTQRIYGVGLCKRGHNLNETGVIIKTTGARHCRVCTNRAKRQRYAIKRLERSKT